eukprot:230990-Pyramimonas_sp.AAC.1
MGVAGSLGMRKVEVRTNTGAVSFCPTGTSPSQVEATPSCLRPVPVFPLTTATVSCHSVPTLVLDAHTHMSVWWAPQEARRRWSSSEAAVAEPPSRGTDPVTAVPRETPPAPAVHPCPPQSLQPLGTNTRAIPRPCTRVPVRGKTFDACSMKGRRAPPAGSGRAAQSRYCTRPSLPCSPGASAAPPPPRWRCRWP